MRSGGAWWIGFSRENGPFKDDEVIRKEAHAIKGGASNLTALHLSDSASELEQLAREHELQKAGEALVRLKESFNALKLYAEENAYL